LALTFAEIPGHAQTPDALPFSKGFLLSGSYAVGSVDLDPKAAAGGVVSGTIPMSGVPADAEVVAAYLYWEMITTNAAQVDGTKFRGLPITVVKASPLTLTPANAPCWSSGGGSGATYTMTMFRADVFHLLPIQLDGNGKPTGRRLVNDTDLLNNGLALNTVTLPNGNSGNQIPSAAGATLFVLYRSASMPLTKVVVYDGIYLQSPGVTMHQTIRGFYQSAAAKSAKLTHIVGSGSPNSTDRILFNGTPLAADPFVGSTARSPIVRVEPHLRRTSRCRESTRISAGEQVSTDVDHGKATLRLPRVGGRLSKGQTPRRRHSGQTEDVSLTEPDGTPLPDTAMGATSTHKGFFVKSAR
jgi:hypothetical protein